MGDFGICSTTYVDIGTPEYSLETYLPVWGIASWWQKIKTSQKNKLVQNGIFKSFHRDRLACALILISYYDSRLYHAYVNTTFNIFSSTNQSTSSSTNQSWYSYNSSMTSNDPEMIFLKNIIHYLLNDCFIKQQLLPYVDVEKSLIFQTTLSGENKTRYDHNINKPRPPIWRRGGSSPNMETWRKDLNFTKDGDTRYHADRDDNSLDDTDENSLGDPNDKRNGVVVLNFVPYTERVVSISNTESRDHDC